MKLRTEQHTLARASVYLDGLNEALDLRTAGGCAVLLKVLQHLRWGAGTSQQAIVYSGAMIATRMCPACSAIW
jgi:hypothetical protein